MAAVIYDEPHSVIMELADIYRDDEELTPNAKRVKTNNDGSASDQLEPQCIADAKPRDKSSVRELAPASVSRRFIVAHLGKSAVNKNIKKSHERQTSHDRSRSPRRDRSRSPHRDRSPSHDRGTSDDILEKIIRAYLQLIKDKLGSVKRRNDVYAKMYDIIKMVADQKYNTERERLHCCMLLTNITNRVIDEMNDIIKNPFITAARNPEEALGILGQCICEPIIKNNVFQHNQILKIIMKQDIDIELMEQYVSSIRSMIDALIEIEKRPYYLKKYDASKMPNSVSASKGNFRMCAYWASKGYCRNGDQCNFVHSV